MADYSKNFMNSVGAYNKLFAEEDPGDKTRDDYYKANATLAHYKGILNDRLKEKNPKAFQEYFKGLTDLRRSGKSQEALKYVQDTPYEEYLSSDEVKDTLGEQDYNRYLQSLQQVNAYNVAQGQQPLYGSIEGQNDISKLNYGRRFASLQVTPSIALRNNTRGTSYNRSYAYNPNTGQVDFTEAGDLSLRPSFLSPPSK